MVTSHRDTLTHRPSIVLEEPGLADGKALWRIARDSGKLDLNSSYSYLLWCRDFAATSVVARDGDEVVGFVTGYIRPDMPDTLMVWQVAVDAGHRGLGLAGGMLRHLVERQAALGRDHLETTITADNPASIALFEGLGRATGARVHRTELFGSALFPDGHDAEVLFRIGPFALPSGV